MIAKHDRLVEELAVRIPGASAEKIQECGLGDMEERKATSHRLLKQGPPTCGLRREAYASRAELVGTELLNEEKEET